MSHSRPYFNFLRQNGGSFFFPISLIRAKNFVVLRTVKDKMGKTSRIEFEDGHGLCYTKQPS